MMGGTLSCVGLRACSLLDLEDATNAPCQVWNQTWPPWALTESMPVTRPALVMGTV
jgi:hypothetical protein